jgi:hypothetical protein
MDEFPEMQPDDLHPDVLCPVEKRLSKACMAVLLQNDVPTCEVGFVVKPFFYLYGDQIHNRVGIITTMFHKSEYKADRERSHRSNGSGSIIIEPKRD